MTLFMDFQLTDFKYTTLSEAAGGVLSEASPAGKVALTNQIAGNWARGALTEIGKTLLPTRPARPEKPELLAPRDVPKRKTKGLKGRLALMHAIAHIELNAIDLAWDLIARFTDANLPTDYYQDWIGVAVDEARHFGLLENYLSKHGATYGDFPAHDGLWEAAEDTSGDILARLAIVPLVLEARGLDATPPTILKLRQAGDDTAADILATIAEEEIAHVAAGVKWFNFLCAEQNLEPTSTYQSLVGQYFKGKLKPPFAVEARTQAGFIPEYYQPIATD